MGWDKGGERELSSETRSHLAGKERKERRENESVSFPYDPSCLFHDSSSLSIFLLVFSFLSIPSLSPFLCPFPVFLSYIDPFMRHGNILTAYHFDSLPAFQKSSFDVVCQMSDYPQRVDNRES